MDLPGPTIVGHLGCGTIVRRAAYLDVGGYSEVLGFGAEEGLLTLDLATRGWARSSADNCPASCDGSQLLLVAAGP